MNHVRPLRFALLTVVALLGCGAGELAPADPPAPPEVPDARSCEARVADQRDGLGPAPLLDDPAFSARPADFGIDRDSVQHQQAEVGGRQVHLVTFTVTTFEDRFGRDWTHNVLLAAPAPDDLAATDAATFTAGMGTLNPVAPGEPDPVWGTEHPEWFAGSDGQQQILLSFGDSALGHGLPLVGTNVVPPELEFAPDLVAAIQEELANNGDPCDDDKCAGPITGDNDKMECLSRATFVREELANDPYINLAVAQSRILDAAEVVMEELYSALGSPIDLDWGRVWTIGSSKRGNTQRIAAAVDPRIAGVVVSAADISAIPDFFEMQSALWVGGYSFGAPDSLPSFESDFGQDWLDAFDTARWQPSVLDGVTYVLAVGVRDPLYPLPASLLYTDALPADHRLVLVPDYGHGQGSVDHAGAFRALIDEGFGGQPWPRVAAAWDLDTDVVTANVTGEVAAVELWCTAGLRTNTAVSDLQPDCSSVPMEATDSTDLRHMSWQRSPMTDLGDGAWEAAAPATTLAFPACLVRAQSADGKPITSGPLLSEPLCAAAGLQAGPG